MSILIYSQKNSKRLDYSLELLFQTILKTSYTVTTDKTIFLDHNGPKINYSDEQILDCISIVPTKLLFNKGIEEIEVDCFEWNNTKALFKTSNNDIPFDVFAASFYLSSRYEEYLPHKRDVYNRFLAEQSTAVKNNFITQPLINIWSLILQKKILEKYPTTVFSQNKFRFITTIDIDNAFAYIEKGFVRTLGALTNTLIKNKFKEFILRIKYLTKQLPDPYDTFEIMHQLHQKYQLNDVYYFFLLGDYAPNDKNISINSKKFQKTIKHVADYYKVGIHPSFASNYDKSKLKTEIERLSTTIHREIKDSRQHFLKLRFPYTYRQLIEHGINNDFTMGYASTPGFRASICTPYYFYDIDREEKTTLMIYPFCFMDATFKYYLNFTPAQTISKIKEIVEIIKSVEGTCISLWHNESLSGMTPWQNWETTYEEMLKTIISIKNDLK
jgi:hypothetical protein